MPSGFTKDPNFGLGLDRTLSFITEAVSQVEGIEHLRLTDEKMLEVSRSADGKTFEMGYRLFDELRLIILDLAFNVPVLLLQGQAHVGGKKVNGAGETITDFLFANALTDNIAVLEIKTAHTKLLAKREYRGSVFGPSSELVAAATQVLDQVNHLQSDIYKLKVLNPEHRMESFGIRGVLVIGTIPEDPLKRSFELYRNALTGVAVITFDELLAKLRSLRTLLGGDWA